MKIYMSNKHEETSILETVEVSHNTLTDIFPFKGKLLKLNITDKRASRNDRAKTTNPEIVHALLSCQKTNKSKIAFRVQSSEIQVGSVKVMEVFAIWGLPFPWIGHMNN